MRISRIMLHRFEEPCISGSDPQRGSGAVFFAGCPLHCVYCQNREISCGGVGRVYTPNALAKELALLEEKGAYNINFVTPTHFTDRIIDTLNIYRPGVPIVFNTSGYEKKETLQSLYGYPDIFLADMKYGSSEAAERYSSAPDYPEVALEAISQMIRLVGPPSFDENGMMKKGVIVRHLILPGERRDSVLALERLFKAVGCDSILLSLMSQYTPDFAQEGIGSLHRRVTSFEYNFVLERAQAMGFEGFGQDRNSASRVYTPDFFES